MEYTKKGYEVCKRIVENDGCVGIRSITCLSNGGECPLEYTEGCGTDGAKAYIKKYEEQNMKTKEQQIAEIKAEIQACCKGFEKRIQELEKSALPTSWEGLDKINGFYVSSRSRPIEIIDGTTTLSGYENTFATEAQAQACVAMAQLSQLMKAYNGDWEADWRGGSIKHTIEIFNGGICTDTSCHASYFLAFPTAELRDTFLANFRQLIEQAKPLL